MRTLLITVLLRADWKEHRSGCSVLPTEPLELPTIFFSLEELNAEVEKVQAMLQKVWDDIEVSVRLSGLLKAH